MSKQRWLAVSVVVVAVLVAATAALVLRPTETGSSYPDEWDPRVAPFAEIVEDERGLEFEHPVHVDFLSVEEFRERVTEDDQELTDEDREEIRASAGLFRALGLLESDRDLLETLNELRGAGVLGYYSHDDERIRMRGKELTPDVRSTLVHELTHALQDQHFDLGGRLDELEEADDSAAVAAFRAIVEGDASRIETAWREDLDEDEREALSRAQQEEQKQFGKDSAGVPEVLKTLMGAPYAFGEALLRVAVADGGEDAVDAMFEEPPTTEEHLVDPWTFVEDADPAIEVAEPDLGPGQEEFDSGQIGSLGWLLVLAERVPAGMTLKAVDGWGGDAYVAYEQDDLSCVDVHYRADTGRDLREMRTALEEWTSRMPDARLGTADGGSTVTFRSCEPTGAAGSEATGGSRAAVKSAVTRAHLSAALVDVGFDAATARCGAQRLLRELTPAELNAPSENASRMRAILGGCVSDRRP